MITALLITIYGLLGFNLALCAIMAYIVIKFSVYVFSRDVRRNAITEKIKTQNANIVNPTVRPVVDGMDLINKFHDSIPITDNNPRNNEGISKAEFINKNKW